MRTPIRNNPRITILASTVQNATTVMPASGPGPAIGGTRHGAHRSWGDLIFALAARASGGLVLLLLGGIILSLFIGGIGAFRHFGLGFVTSTAWNPVKQDFGALVSVYGTLVTSAIALVLAVPLAFGIAFYLTELAPAWLRRPVGTAIELLAAVPSIIYGMWGFFVIVPIMSGTIQPAIISAFDGIPVLQDLFAGPPFGTGIFTAAFILAVMVIPFVAATMRDVFETVPAVYKESAYGLGCTTWEVMRSIVLPYTRVSVVGGIMLGLGRALGETMAVTFVIGNADRISTSLFGSGNTIASIVALEFPESPAGSLKLASLLALGFILFVISFIVLAISRMLLRPKVAA
jgi:phosphate transport system permease protein